MLVGDKLFGDLPEQSKPQVEAVPLGAPRLSEPQCDQIALRVLDIDRVIGEDHLVRLIWSYIEEPNLSELENLNKARGDRPGHPATSPGFCWRWGSMPPARASAARGRWSGCANAMTPIAGCSAGCR